MAGLPALHSMGDPRRRHAAVNGAPSACQMQLTAAAAIS
jgi:hypothetical protein